MQKLDMREVVRLARELFMALFDGPLGFFLMVWVAYRLWKDAKDEMKL
jgi:hypothetical protein